MYVVLPFRHRGDAPTPLLKGDQCESLLHDALRRWRDVSVVDPLWVSDARARTAGQPLTLESGLAMARVRGAGAMVTGEVWQVGESVYVRGALYDVEGRGQAIRQHTVAIAPDLSDAARRFRELAGVLVTGSAAADSGTAATVSLAAWRSYEAGRAALLRWDLPEARRHLKAAVDKEPQYAEANLALATVMSWAADPPEAWRGPAATAAERARGPDERSRALGLVALADGRYAEACATFRDLMRRDSLDFGAWLGLGDCLARDELVEKDPTSRSGWKFRSSGAGAAAAYRRALETYPSVHRAAGAFALRRLEGVVFTEPHHYRGGFALAPDTLWFGAFPAIDHDTIAFVPYPREEALSFRGPAYPASIAEALARGRALLRSVTGAWVRAFPESSEALEVHALALETDGLLADGPPIGSALASIVAARRGNRDTTAALRLAVAETRLRVKRAEFAAARRLADSLLATVRPGAPPVAGTLAALAALTGRVGRAAALLAQSEPSFEDSTGGSMRVPGPVAEAALSYAAYGALGAPAESLEATRRRVRGLMTAYVEPSRRNGMETALFAESGVLAFPALAPAMRPPLRGHHPLNPALEAFQRGDAGQARRALAALHGRRSHWRAGSVAADATFVEAWLMTQLGDSADAAAFLDLSLGALPTQRTALLTETPQAAGLVRAMVLRADLAHAAGDAATAGRSGPSCGYAVGRRRASAPSGRAAHAITGPHVRALMPSSTAQTQGAIMRARTVWTWVMCGWTSVGATGCAPARPTPAPPGPVTPEDQTSLREACQDRRLRWAETKARLHQTIEGADLKLLPEKSNHKTKPEDIENEGRVLALLVVQSGELMFANGTAGTGDSVCIFLKGEYPNGDSPGNVRSTSSSGGMGWHWRRSAPMCGPVRL